MKTGNWTSVAEFILLGLTDDSKLKILLFICFCLIYLISILGNVGIFVLIVVSSRLHRPMYFLLSNLAFLDLCFTSVTTPVMLIQFLSVRNTISFARCALQMFFTYASGTSEVVLLAVMAYDRYIAICYPLRYTVIMNNIACISFLVFTYVIGSLNALIHAVFTFTLSFCETNEITHFFCDVPPILKISCSDTSLNELLLVVLAGGIISTSFANVLTSYAFIMFAVLKIRSSESRWKAFNTCSSHFVSVVLFFGTLVFMYAKPTSSHSMAQDRVVSVVYTVMIPMLNPLIYSLRNKEVKEAIRKSLRTLGFRIQKNCTSVCAHILRKALLL